MYLAVRSFNFYAMSQSAMAKPGDNEPALADHLFLGKGKATIYMDKVAPKLVRVRTPTSSNVGMSRNWN